MDKNEQAVKIASARFKRDYVAGLAIILFIVIVICEIVMAVSIPVLVRKESLWSRRVAKQDMSQMFDDLRERFQGASGSRDPRVAGEAALELQALDELAIYLRNNVHALNQEQINRMAEELRRIWPIADQLGQGKSFSRQAPLDPGAFLKRLENDLNSTEKK